MCSTQVAEAAEKPPVFSDVTNGEANAVYINYMAQRGLISGFPDGTFQPAGTVTRAQMAQMLVKSNTMTAKQGPEVHFTDVTPDHWAYKTVTAAVKSGFISGYPDGTFRPESAATRAEVAAMILRLSSSPINAAAPSGARDLDSSHWALSHCAAVLEAGIMGVDAQGNFAPDKPATRADVVKGLALMLTLCPDQNSVSLTGTLVPTGQVQITRANGSIVNVTSASPCYKGDTIITGSNGTAELNFPDGSGLKIKENTQIAIKEAQGCTYITQNGKPGTKVDMLEIELPRGQIFGALASTYHNNIINNEVEESTASRIQSSHQLLASLDLSSVMAAGTKNAQLPWYQQSSAKKVRVKVDMPWGVAAVRGTFWQNLVNANGSGSTTVLTGECEVTAGRQTVGLLPGQSTECRGLGNPPTPPAPMTPQQQQQWNAVFDWFQQITNNMQQNSPLQPQQGNQPSDMPAGSLADQLLQDISRTTPGFNSAPPAPSSHESSGNSSGPPLQQVAAPMATPVAGTYNTAQTVSLSTTTEGADIYYTVDGSDPTVSETKNEYTTPINISETTTIKACAIKAGMSPSDVAQFAYIINSDNPEFTLRLLELTRASVNSDGEETSAAYGHVAHSDQPWLSGDGRFVAFCSYANNLVPGDSNNAEDIFVKDTVSGKVVRVSVTSDGVQGNGATSDQPRITPDGRYVVFRSGCTNLATGNPADDTNANWDIFVHDRDVDGDQIFDEVGQIKTVRVNVTSSGEQAEHSSMAAGSFPSISDDGRFVCFYSTSANLDAGDTNNTSDVFVHDRDTDEDGIYDEPGAIETRRISVSSEGIQSDSDCYFPEMSGNGRYVVYTSGATTLVPGITDFGIYLHDRQTGETSWLGEGSDPQISSDGRYIAFEAYDDIYVLDRTNNTTEKISNTYNGEPANGYCYGQRISPDGRFVTFYSQASNLVNGDTNECSDVFIYDRQNRVLKRLSTTPEGIEGNLESFEISPVSVNGRYVAFTSAASNLVPGDTNNEDDVFLALIDPDAATDSEPPSAPEDLTAEAGLNWAELSWEEAWDNTGIAQYVVYQAQNSDGPFTDVAYVNGVTTSCQVGSLEKNTTYYYYVKALDPDGNYSEPSATISVQTQSAEVPVTGGKRVAAYYGNTAFIFDGSLLTCGDNYYGQLGDGTYDDKYTPTPVKLSSGENFPDAVEVAAGNGYTIALRSDGTVWAWGYNNYGQLGNGTTTNRVYPVQVKGPDGIGFLDGVIAVAAGHNHALALRSDGTVWSWGSNGDGELGNGNSEDSSLPVAVLDTDGNGYLRHIKAIAAGRGHSLALGEDGTVYAWGANGVGQLGQGSIDYTEHCLPVLVLANVESVPLSGVAAIAAQDFCSMALDAEGHVWTWGNNYTGQLGIGTTQYYSSLPVQVVKGASTSTDLYLEDVVSITVGSFNDEGIGLAVRSDGTVWAWGSNHEGQLGIGSEVYSSSNVPVQVLATDLGPLTDAIEVASSGYHSIARTANGFGFYTWGRNWSGELGDGTTKGKPLAQQIP